MKSTLSKADLSSIRHKFKPSGGGVYIIPLGVLLDIKRDHSDPPVPNFGEPLIRGLARARVVSLVFSTTTDLFLRRTNEAGNEEEIPSDSRQIFITEERWTKYLLDRLMKGLPPLHIDAAVATALFRDPRHKPPINDIVSFKRLLWSKIR